MNTLIVSRTRGAFGPRRAANVTVRFAPMGYDPARPHGCWSWHWSLKRYATCYMLRWPGLLVVVTRRHVAEGGGK